MINITNRYLPIVPENLCRYWFFFVVVNVAWNYQLLLMNMMLKVYALHQRSPNIIILLVFLTCVRTGNAIVCWYYFLPAFAYMPNCMPLIKKPSGGMALSTYLHPFSLFPALQLTE
jgi:uncharacterized membrane protein